jgi:hypothetical protein
MPKFRAAHEELAEMVKLEAVQLRRLAAGALTQLNVQDTTAVLDVHELPDGSWSVDFEDRSPETRFPAFTIVVEPDWSADEASRVLRRELRDKLWICPLCQRRARIRRIVDREELRVECDRCGRFEIESVLLDDLRSAVDSDNGIADGLAGLAAQVGNAEGTAYLSLEHWRSISKTPPR